MIHLKILYNTDTISTCFQQHKSPLSDFLTITVMLFGGVLAGGGSKVTSKFLFFFISGSVMHYPRNAFAIDNSIAVITPLIGNPTIGQTRGFSDVSNSLYFPSASIYNSVSNLTTVGRAETQQVVQLLNIHLFRIKKKLTGKMTKIRFPSSPIAVDIFEMSNSIRNFSNQKYLLPFLLYYFGGKGWNWRAGDRLLVTCYQFFNTLLLRKLASVTRRVLKMGK